MGKNDKIQRVVAGQQVAEMVLWVTGWAHCGTLRSASYTTMLALDAIAFHHVASEFRLTEFYPCKYAHAIHQELETKTAFRLGTGTMKVEVDDVDLGIDAEHLVETVFEPDLNYR